MLILVMYDAIEISTQNILSFSPPTSSPVSNITMSKTIVLETDDSVVVRAYPWSNGIVLCKDRHAYLQTALQNCEEPQSLIEMALVCHIQTIYHNWFNSTQLVTVSCKAD
jgi:hypothetical protein